MTSRWSSHRRRCAPPSECAGRDRMSWRNSGPNRQRAPLHFEHVAFFRGELLDLGNSVTKFIGGANRLEIPQSPRIGIPPLGLKLTVQALDTLPREPLLTAQK